MSNSGTRNYSDALDLSDISNLSSDSSELALSGEDINFAEIGELIRQFQEDPRVKDILEKGVDMREYKKQVESDLKTAEQDVVHDYVREAENFAYLHKQIRSSDHILETLSNILNQFQSSLGTISHEIRYLQEQSSSISVKLNNRKEVVGQLGSLVDELVIPSELIKRICEGEVNESYVSSLKILDKKISFVEKHKKKTVACSNVEPELEKLRIKAISRVREFLLQKISSLKKPKTNMQMIQQNVLLKYKDLNHFLIKHASDVALEIKDTYIDTISRIFYHQFRSNIYSLAKLQEEKDQPTKLDLLGAPDAQNKGFFSSRFSKNRQNNIFSLGERAKIIQPDSSERSNLLLIIPHDIQTIEKRYMYETIFFLLNHLLMEMVSNEVIFSRDFFPRLDTFHGIFGKITATFLDSVEEHIVNSFDTLGLLLMIKINHQNLVKMNSKHIDCLNSLFDSLRDLLWSRVRFLLQTHHSSLSSANALTLGGHIDIHPHYITRRYAEFVAGILLLDIEDDSSTIISFLNDLRTSMENLLNRLAEEHSSRMQRIVFLINNYDLILTVLDQQEREITSVETVRYNDLLNNQIRNFVDEELNSYYDTFVMFVKDIPAHMTSSTPSGSTQTELSNTNIDERTVTKLVHDFSKSWKEVIENINRDVITFFANFKTGSEILKQVLKQLVLYYTRFEQMTRKYFPQLSKVCVSVPSLTFEIKKYSRTF